MIYFGWQKCAGLVCLSVCDVNIHLIVQRSHWEWGYRSGWYDGPVRHFGLGPLFLIVIAW